MKKLLPLIVALVLVAVACGDDDSASADPVSGSIRIAGGVAGIDQTWTLATDGTVTRPDGSLAVADPADLAALREAMARAKFFDLDPEYVPTDTCCDRFEYRISLTQGDLSNTVVTIDDADAPEGLFLVIDAFRTAVENAADLEAAGPCVGADERPTTMSVLTATAGTGTVIGSADGATYRACPGLTVGDVVVEAGEGPLASLLVGGAETITLTVDPAIPGVYFTALIGDGIEFRSLPVFRISETEWEATMPAEPGTYQLLVNLNALNSDEAFRFEIVVT
jgi:hypothetical protein